jgi:hypothetical protein
MLLLLAISRMAWTAAEDGKFDAKVGLNKCVLSALDGRGEWRVEHVQIAKIGHFGYTFVSLFKTFLKANIF